MSTFLTINQKYCRLEDVPHSVISPPVSIKRNMIWEPNYAIDFYGNQIKKKKMHDNC